MIWYICLLLSAICILWFIKLADDPYSSAAEGAAWMATLLGTIFSWILSIKSIL